MSYDHSLNTTAVLKPGTTLEAVISAFEPLLDYWGYDIVNGNAHDDHVLQYNPETGELYVYTSGDVGFSYSDLVMATAELLGPLTASPSYFELTDQDTADKDTAIDTIYYGESEDATKAFIANRDIEAAMDLLQQHLTAETVATIRAIASQAAQAKESAAADWMITMPVISTAHITQEVSELLTSYGDDNPWATCACYTDGFFVHVPDDEMADFKEPVPDCLLAVWEWARQKGFDYVRLDSAGDVVDGLKSYTW